MKNLFGWIQSEGSDDGFEPEPEPDFPATKARVGSPEKLRILAIRAELGVPLWHPDDRVAVDDGSLEDE